MRDSYEGTSHPIYAWCPVTFSPHNTRTILFPASPLRSTVSIQVGAAPVDVDPDDKGKLVVTEDTPLKCMFRIANESFTTDR